MDVSIPANTPRVTMKELRAAGLLPKGFRCPQAVRKLPKRHGRLALMCDPLWPAGQADTDAAKVQRLLLKRMQKHTVPGGTLHAYCFMLRHSNQAVWNYLYDKNVLACERHELRRDNLTDSEIARVVILHSLWTQLLEDLPDAVSLLMFNSVRAQLVATLRDDVEGRLPFRAGSGVDDTIVV